MTTTTPPDNIFIPSYPSNPNKNDNPKEAWLSPFWSNEKQRNDSRPGLFKWHEYKLVDPDDYIHDPKLITLGCVLPSGVYRVAGHLSGVTCQKCIKLREEKNK